MFFGVKNTKTAHGEIRSRDPTSHQSRLLPLDNYMTCDEQIIHKFYVAALWLV